MPINILMPALSPTMEKGNLTKWHKKEGDKVSPGDVIAEIETDKATMDYEAVDEGVLAKIVVPEGTTDVPVNQLIAVLAGEGEDLKAATAAAAAEAKPSAPSPAPRAAGASTTTAQPAASDPQPTAVAAGASTTTAQPAASAPQPAAVAARSTTEAHPTPSPATNGQAGRVFSSPLARRLARESSIDIARIQGTGPHGRVVARDVEATKSGGAALRAPSAPGVTPVPIQPPSDDKIRALFEPGSYEVVPHDTMRKVIARRISEAKLTIPHFYLTTTCTVDRLLAAREDINATAPKAEDGKPSYKISVNDFVIKAVALALMKVPDANVTWTEGGLLKHKHADVGVAVSIPGGLITPIVRKAEHKSLIEISNEMKDYGARARARRLKPQEYEGGTTAISNLGMYGVHEFSAVINPPHATILAVGATEQRPVVENGAILIAHQMTITLSVDHRAVDGVLGAQLLAAIKLYVENPVGMLV
jgi:pyruvate dehydrogenase E2 component (dihydrolipoamide acetyltransferase)